MKRFSLLFIVVISMLFAPQLHAQRGKDGAKTITAAATIVNEYTYLTQDATAGSTTLTVASSQLNTNSRFAGPLAPGDLLFIIQVQGATIQNGAWWWNWGFIDNYNNTGNNEMVEVLAVPGGTAIQLSCPLQKSYTAAGKVVVVRVQRYSSLTINSGGELTCEAWNGTTGGILAVEVLGNTVINSGGTVNVSVKGFRGGLETDNTSSYAIYQYASTDNALGAMKGESIAGWGTEYDLRDGRYGRSSPANGGGGGNAHNAGGGGGANGGLHYFWVNGKGNPDTSTASWKAAWDLEGANFHKNAVHGGGRGGYSYSWNNMDATVVKPDTSLWGGDYRRNIGGYGGRPLDYSTGRLFLAGGGGAGDQDDSYGGAGGTGAGMAYIVSYGTISGSGSVVANGQAGFNAQGTAPFNSHAGIDGAGGGGAGGTIILNATGNISGISVIADGGKGGDQVKTKSWPAADNGEAEGPGGGGSGGYIGTSASTAWKQANGGTNGICTASSGGDNGMTEFPPNGATKGGPGTTNGVVTNFTITAVGDSVCPGQTATLTASLSGTVPGGTIINWYDAAVGGNLLTSGNTYTINNLSATTTYYAGTCPGTYRVAVVAYLYNFSIDAGNNDTVCSGQTLQLNATGGSSYLWSPAAGLSDSSIATPVFSGTVTTTYHVTIQANNGCSGTDSLTITVNTVSATVTTDTSVCAGQYVDLIATGGTSYHWSNGPNSALNHVSPATDQAYSVTVTNNGCSDTLATSVHVNPVPLVFIGNDTVFCQGNTLLLNAGNPGASYLWQDNSVAQTFNVSSSGTYYVRVTNGSGCSAIDTIHVSVLQNADATITNVAPVCQNIAAFNLVAAGGGGTWSGSGITNAAAGTFNPSVAGPGLFIITYTIPGLCGDTDTASIRVYPLPVVGLGDDTTFCQGGTLVLDAGNPGATYHWQDNSIAQTLTVTTTNIYSVTVTDGNTCASRDSISVTVLPNMDATINAVTPLCANAAPVILAAADPGGIWSGAGITGQNPPTFDPGTAGAGSTLITYAIGGLCGDTSSTTIIVYTVPAINATNVLPVCPAVSNGAVSLSIVSGTPPYAYTWNTGDTTAAISGLTPGTYTVTVSDSHNCKATHSSDMNVELNCHGTPVIYLPNVFSPNNQGLQENEVLYVKGEEIASFTLVIYDRWGEKIFESSALDYGWDGRYQSKEMPAGVYVYYLEAKMTDGSEVKKHGNVTLVR